MRLGRTILLVVCLLFSFLTFAQIKGRSDSLTIAALKELGVNFTNNNCVTLLPSGEEKFKDLFAAISQARHYVYLEYFNFRNDSIGKKLFGLLAEKAAEGVTVRVIFDDFGNISNDRPLRDWHLRMLERRNIHVQKFDPMKFPWINHAFHRDHRKIVVIDGEIVYTGGMNVADYYITGRPEIGEWRDMHVRIEGDCVLDYRDIFCSMWARISGAEIDSLEYCVLATDKVVGFEGLKENGCGGSGNVLVGVANREPKRSPRTVRRSYIASIDNAKECIQIVNPYFSLVLSVKKALHRALKRGVRVEIMLSTKCDVAVLPDVAAYQAKRLMKRGADVYYYEDGFHHSKVMMIDSALCTVGSANLNSRSMKYDYEVNAFIVDSCTTQSLQRIFEADKGCSTLLTPENWKKRRSFKRRFLGWFYHFFVPVI